MTTGRINQVAVSSSTARARVGNHAPPTSAQLKGTGARRIDAEAVRIGWMEQGGWPSPPRENTFPFYNLLRQRAGV